MVTLEEVEQQLKELGVHKRFTFWGRPEIVELQHILIPNEKIKACLNGHYEGGFAVLVATDQRLLLIDKKLLHLSVEDIRYDMIAEMDFSSQLASAVAKVCTPTKNLSFTVFRPRDLRKLVTYVQQRVLEIRQQYAFHEQGQQPELQSQTVPQQQGAPMAPFAPYIASPISPPPASIDEQPAPSLPIPNFRNPYMHPPLMMRRKVGRFGRISPAAPKY